MDDANRAQAKGARPLILRGIYDFLRIHQTGSKSGALLLTMLDFTIPRGDERLTKGGAESAVRNATPAATHAALEQPASKPKALGLSFCAEETTF